MPQAGLWFAYDAGQFDGYARQPDARLRTIEGALIEGLRARDLIDEDARVPLRTGSRTDREVSARRNLCVVEATVPADRVAPALGATVPGLWPLASVEVPDGFDPRRALSRTYRYHVPEVWLPRGVGAEELEEVGQAFVGTHDMRAFAKLQPGKSPIRHVTGVEAVPVAGGVAIMVSGQSFLWRQVRRMVSAMLAVVRGEAEVAVIRRALEAPDDAPDLGLVTGAPLALWDVRYRDVPSPGPRRAHMSRLEERRWDAWGGAMARAGMLAALWDEP